ncbi:unnamed protein product [Mytilus coruscus]|uniref:Novel STAND NTPase 3 domain-containing protein n=1 Tax=Mytilus coruscus TaxID=42192 RepID=A0A6J8EWW8_MYTCO|nr:unnamed protein product [Mytilus coruscus]
MMNLEDKGVQILTGTAGTGKSRNSLELLRQYSEKHAGYHGIKLQKVQEWRALICKDDFLVVLFDDIFGQTSFRFTADDEHIFETINSVIEAGNVKVIFTIRNTLKSEPNVASMLSRQQIFKRSILIDLNSDEMIMTKEQKEQILMKHCKANKIFVTNTTDSNKDTLILDPSVTMYIRRSEINRIVETESNPIMGFPLSCYLFASDRKLTRLGANFFKHPSRFLLDEIQSLQVSGEKDKEKAVEYAILVYVMMNDDFIKIDDLPTGKINKVLKTLYEREDINSEEVRKGLERLTHRYLKNNARNWVYEDYRDEISPCLRLKESFLTSLLVHSLKYTDNDDAIKQILKYMENDLKVVKNNYAHVGYESCFINGILQACVDMNERRLLKLVDFVKRYKIKCHSFHISQSITVPMLRFLLSHLECDAIDINFILLKAIECQDMSLVESIFERQDASCIVIAPAMLHACKFGTIDTVLWFCEVFKREDLHVEKVLKVSCSNGNIEIVNMLCTRFDMDAETLNIALLKACKTNQVSVLSFMINRFQTEKKLFLDTAVDYALTYRNLETIKLLIENTNHHFRTKELLENYKSIITANDCGADINIIKYLITVDQDFEIDDLLTIAENALWDFEIVEWVSKLIDVKSFYISCLKHKWIHKSMCVLRREYETGFYLHFNEEDVIAEEIEFGNTDCISFLFEKFDLKKIDKKLIIERICLKGDENLLKLIIDKFGSDFLDMISVVQTALREGNLNIVKWILKNTSKEILDLNFLRKSDGISLFISLLEEFSDTNSESRIVKHETKSATVNQYLQKLLTWYLQDNINLCKLSHNIQMGLQKTTHRNCILVASEHWTSRWMHRNLYFSHFMMEKILYNACDSCNIALVKFILEECNPNESAMKNLMRTACRQGSLELVQLIYSFYSLASLSIETVFTHACNSNNLRLVEWWFQRIDPMTFKFKLVVKNITSINIDTIIFLIQNFDVDALDFAAFCTVFCLDHTDYNTDEIRLQLQLCFLESYTYNAINIVDIKSVFDQICYSMSDEEAKWIVSLVDHKRLNFISATLEAIRGEHTATALYLLKSMDHEDLKKVNSIFTHACVAGNCTVVKFLIDRFDKCLNVNEVFESRGYNDNIFVRYFQDTLKVLFEKLDVETIHINGILHTSCRNGFVDLTKWLINNVDNSVLDFTNALKIAFSEKKFRMTDNDIELIQCLLEYSKPSFIDCHLLMKKTCLTGKLSHLTWLLKCFEPDIFEVRSAILYTSMNTKDPGGTSDKIRFILSSCQCIHSDIQFSLNIACAMQNVSLMEWTVNRFDSHTLDLQHTLKIALNHVNEEIIQFLFDKKKNLHLDLQQALDNACVYKRISAIKWLFNNFNLNVNVDRAIRFCLKINRSYDYDDEEFDIANEECNIVNVFKLLFQLFDAEKFNILFIIHSCLKEKRKDLVLWILQVCDHSLFDIQKVLCEVCRHGEINCIFYLLHTCNYGKYVNEQCLLNAFASGIFENATKLITVFPDVYFDIKIAMNHACFSGNLPLVQWLFYTYSSHCVSKYVRSNFDLKSAKRKFDLNTAMINACKNGKTDVVQWLLQLYVYETFDMESAFNSACASDSRGLVEWMLVVYDHEIFNIEFAMTCACQNGRLKVVQCLFEIFSTNAFNMETVINEAVGSGDIRLVRWLHQTIDSKLYNIKAAMKKACLNNRSDVVRWILDNFDHSYFNMKMVTIAACDWGRI